MQEVKILMDEKRSLFIQSQDGTIYDFWPQGWGIPVSFMVKTKEEQVKDNEERERRDKELLKEEKKQEEQRKNTKRWYKSWMW